MPFRMELTYSEIERILDMKNIDTSTTRYTPPPGIFELNDVKLLLKSLLPNETKVNISNDDIRLESKRTTNKTITFTKKSFLCKTMFYSKPFWTFGWYWKICSIDSGIK